MVLLAGLLAGCISAQSREAVRVLDDIDVGRAASALKEQTPEPLRRALAVPNGAGQLPADLYEPRQEVGARLVLVPGFTPAGKDDPRVIDLAKSLARARFLVLVPDLAGSRAERVRLADADDIADATRFLADLPADAPADTGIAAISYAVGLAIHAALEPELLARLDFLIGVGGYHDAESVIAFMTTGRFREHPDAAWRTGDPYPESKWVFLASHVDALSDPDDRALFTAIAERRLERKAAPIDDLAARLGPEGRSVLDLVLNTEPARVPALIAALPEALREEMEALSPGRRDLRPLAGRLVLIHGREDRLIPWTESVALAQAAGRAELFLIDGFSHIEPDSVGVVGRLQLIDAMQAVLARRS